MNMPYHTRSQGEPIDNLSENNCVTEGNKNKYSAYNKLLKEASSMLCLLVFSVFYYANKMLVCVWKIGGIYIVWCTLHHVTSQLYVYYCTPYTLIGFLTAPFMVATPQCTGLRWCIAHGAETIISMWLVLGTWFVQKLGGYSLNG